MVGAGTRGRRERHASATASRRFVHEPLRSADGSAPLGGTGAATALRRPPMSLVVLIGAAALAAACLAARSGAGLSVHAALRGAVPAVPRTRSVTSRTARVRTATGVRIAIVDTGVTPVGSIAGRVAAGADFVDSAGTTADHNGHGTAMATIAGGVCPTCAIVPVRALGDSGMGTTTLAAEGVRWATANGARVINLSLTSPGPDADLTAAIEDAVASGVVVVVAAGNSGSADPSAQGYPGAAAADALTVASANPADQLYAWSNRGAWVHFAAPGELSALGTNGQAMNAVGTSGSAAYVSGAAGLLLSCNPSLTPAQVRSALAATAQPVAGLAGGLVQPQAALRSSTPATGCAA